MVRWCSGVAVVALVAGTALGAAPVAAAQMVLAPGTPVVMVADDGSGREQCTAGFVVRNVKRAPLIFTAGHCGAAGSVLMKTSGGDLPVGEIVVSQYEGTSGEDSDIAVIRPTGSASLVSTVDGTLVAGVLPWVYPGLTLCKLGATSGRSCGPVLEVSESKVKFAAKVAEGDSGGPVWAMTDDGFALAVGVTIRHAGGGLTVAELLSPWMQRYNLDATPV